MHEYSICTRIVDAAIGAHQNHGAGRVVSVRVRAGGLHQIIPDYMHTAFELLTRDTPIAGATLDLTVTPVTVHCRACNTDGEVDPPLFQCRNCQSLEVDMTAGTELSLDSIEVTQDDDETESTQEPREEATTT